MLQDTSLRVVIILHLEDSMLDMARMVRIMLLLEDDMHDLLCLVVTMSLSVPMLAQV